MFIIFGGESRQREIIQIDKAVEKIAGGIDLDRQRPSDKSICTLCAPFLGSAECRSRARAADHR